MQYVTGYTTEPAGGGESASALLGDDAKADDATGGGLLKTGASGDATGGGLLDASGDGGGLHGGEDDLVPQIVLVGTDRKRTRLDSSHDCASRMQASA